MLRIFILIAIMAFAASAAHASGLNIKKSNLIEFGKSDRLTAYVVKDSKTTNADGSVGADVLFTYTELGSKLIFASTKKADRPNVALMTYHVKCNEAKSRITYVKTFRPGRDLEDGPIKQKYGKIADGSIESVLMEVVCSPNFE
ncbi:MAG: hypothetical protein PHP95_14060 [Desulfuromonadaceae bacterium]|nr:hypothetical protein [Desulfuromonadaceae bacterium]MDD2849573.1 hypothetical protein [Desulfuromonadaceae bacterium]MDD4131999.1 hypothetical protein [Desulfuromonadaceae bacterium]